MKKTYLIETEGLTKAYGSITALANLTVRIEQGAVGLLGPNGSGKTTLIKLLMGLIRPTYGTGRVLGLPIETRGIEIRSKVGYMPEVECFVPEMTGVELVANFGRISGMSIGDAYQRAYEVLDYVGLHDKLNDPVDTYSQGQKQRVKLAQALVHDPPLLFLDEPTNGLDPSGREDMLGLIKSLHRDFKKSIFLSSHILMDVEAVCDKVLLLNNGVDLAYKRLSEILQKDKNSYFIKVKNNKKDKRNNVAAFLRRLREMGYDVWRTTNGYRLTSEKEEVFDEVVKAAVEAGCELRALTRTKRTLEEVYLDLLGEAEKPLSDEETAEEELEEEEEEEEEEEKEEPQRKKDLEKDEDVVVGKKVMPASLPKEEKEEEGEDFKGDKVDKKDKRADLEGLKNKEVRESLEKEDTEKLISLLESEDGECVIEVLEALKRLKDKTALLPIMSLLEKEGVEKSVREKAKEVIQSFAGGD